MGEGTATNDLHPILPIQYYVSVLHTSLLTTVWSVIKSFLILIRRKENIDLSGDNTLYPITHLSRQFLNAFQIHKLNNKD